MGMPSKKELDKIRKKLLKAEPSWSIPDDASNSDKLKGKICQEFVKAINSGKYTQAELARVLEIDRSRMNDIVKYKIHFFTVDRLLKLLEKFKPEMKVILK